MMNCQRAFKILEIDQTKQTDAIRKQYKILALRWHPDKNKDIDTTAKMQKIIAAYIFLTKNKPAPNWVVSVYFGESHPK